MTSFFEDEDNAPTVRELLNLRRQKQRETYEKELNVGDLREEITDYQRCCEKCIGCCKTENSRFAAECLQNVEKSFSQINCKKCKKPFDYLANDEHTHWRNDITCKHCSHLLIFRCDSCDKPFRSLSMYHRHLRERHIIETTLYCFFCNKCFASCEARQEHMEERHYRRRRRECLDCGEPFSKSYERKQQHQHTMGQVEDSDEPDSDEPDYGEPDYGPSLDGNNDRDAVTAAVPNQHLGDPFQTPPDVTTAKDAPTTPSTSATPTTRTYVRKTKKEPVVDERRNNILHQGGSSFCNRREKMAEELNEKPDEAEEQRERDDCFPDIKVKPTTKEETTLFKEPYAVKQEISEEQLVSTPADLQGQQQWSFETESNLVMGVEYGPVLKMEPKTIDDFEINSIKTEKEDKQFITNDSLKAFVKPQTVTISGAPGEQKSIFAGFMSMSGPSVMNLKNIQVAALEMGGAQDNFFCNLCNGLMFISHDQLECSDCGKQKQTNSQKSIGQKRINKVSCLQKDLSLAVTSAASDIENEVVAAAAVEVLKAENFLCDSCNGLIFISHDKLECTNCGKEQKKFHQPKFVNGRLTTNPNDVAECLRAEAANKLKREEESKAALHRNRILAEKGRILAERKTFLWQGITYMEHPRNVIEASIEGKQPKQNSLQQSRYECSMPGCWGAILVHNDSQVVIGSTQHSLPTCPGVAGNKPGTKPVPPKRGHPQYNLVIKRKTDLQSAYRIFDAKENSKVLKTTDDFIDRKVFPENDVTVSAPSSSSKVTVNSIQAVELSPVDVSQLAGHLSSDEMVFQWRGCPYIGSNRFSKYKRRFNCPNACCKGAVIVQVSSLMVYGSTLHKQNCDYSS